MEGTAVGVKERRVGNRLRRTGIQFGTWTQDLGSGVSGCDLLQRRGKIKVAKRLWA